MGVVRLEIQWNDLEEFLFKLREEMNEWSPAVRVRRWLDGARRRSEKISGGALNRRLNDEDGSGERNGGGGCSGDGDGVDDH